MIWKDMPERLLPSGKCMWINHKAKSGKYIRGIQKLMLSAAINRKLNEIKGIYLCLKPIFLYKERYGLFILNDYCPHEHPIKN